MGWEKLRGFISRQEGRTKLCSICLKSWGHMNPSLCLVADDSPTIRKVVRIILRSFEFEMDEAENGKIALEKCEHRMPDIILLDWNMPVMNGIEFLRLLRGMESGSTPKVIVCTTETDVEHIREAIEVGADEYLMKPFDAEMLTAKVKLAMAHEKVTSGRPSSLPKESGPGLPPREHDLLRRSGTDTDAIAAGRLGRI